MRKIVVIVEETHQEGGHDIHPPTRKAAAIAVVQNPYAGIFQADLEVLIDMGERLGWLLGKRAVAALGIEPGQVQSYGKAAIVGEDGELEGGGFDPVGQEARRDGGGDRCPAGP
jgi:hypothetical protein